MLSEQELEQTQKGLNGPKLLCQSLKKRETVGLSRIWFWFQRILKLANMFCLGDGIPKTHHRSGALVPTSISSNSKILEQIKLALYLLSLVAPRLWPGIIYVDKPDVSIHIEGTTN